ncbi:hydrolase tropI [Hyphodiscus hymeniophilus]|uniref:Hydrolase tropI n=1 Tax=Hyphodiscus hymeniophilus TaxID=353542 RepID=A0A9P6VPY5_9HELO|nr:hydrolase tropI [Hyphodiscus hymeniophilus]
MAEPVENNHPCCDPAAPSSIWDGNSTGSLILIDGIETYITHPRSQNNPSPPASTNDDKKRVILFLTEGHSIYFINAQLLADSFASQLGCDVIMPDQFGGRESVPPGQLPHFPEGKFNIPEGSDKPPYGLTSTLGKPGLDAWKRPYEPPITDPILAKVVRYLHRSYGENVKIGGVGYCFGGRYVMRLLGSGVLDVGVVNHPSFYTLEEVEKIGPGKRLALYGAETDDILPAEKRRATEDILTKSGATWMSTVFSATKHGFSVRGDLTVKEIRVAKERAFEGAVDWFGDWL